MGGTGIDVSLRVALKRRVPVKCYVVRVTLVGAAVLVYAVVVIF